MGGLLYGYDTVVISRKLSIVKAQFTGIDAIIYYGSRILETAGFALNYTLGRQISIGTVNMIFTLLAIWKTDKFGRKPLFLSGTLGMFISVIAIGFLDFSVFPR